MATKIPSALTKIALTSGAAVGALAAHDLLQKKHSLLRTFPVVGHGRYFMEKMRAPMHQYFIENNYDGRPFDRDTRSMIYEYSKGLGGEKAFGTERKMQTEGYESLRHSMAPVEQMKDAPRVRLGGPDCTQPYNISIFNISSMSFGSLSSRAVLAMNKGAAMGGFAQETGEGGITKYHLEHDADLIWEFGSGYFGCRDEQGNFSPEKFVEKAALPQVKGILIKLSQGAKPGMGGLLPAAKVTAEIAEARGVPEGQDCLSPAAHSAFSTPLELMYFVQQLREFSGGKPIGIKFCVGSTIEVLSLCKAMIETGITPDWITVDGAEGGTGAAPVEYEDTVGTTLTDGLYILQNALIASGLRDKITIGAAGKIAGGADIIKRIALGADFTNSARGMMMAVGCLQTQQCHENTCPTGVATQNPWLVRGIDVDDKGVRVRNYHAGVIHSATRLLASMGLTSFDELSPEHVMHRTSVTHSQSLAKIYNWLEPGSFLDGSAHKDWQSWWDRADARCFTPSHKQHQRPARPGAN